MPETVLFDRYRLIEPAGSGGSAEVWRAVDVATGEVVAVKRLHPLVFADEAGRRRLRREFEALRSLDEPHVVRVRDLLFGEREAALILDFVPGESLARRLARVAADGAAIPPDEAVAIVSDVAAALGAAHAAGIVHRDVTPGNILLTSDGEARLTDFGIAHAEGDAGGVTATGLLMGTMRYLAPEQLRGAASTPASDLHGLAAVAYEMLAGHPAYEATSPVALAEAQADGPAPIERVPRAVDAVVRAGLAVDPAARPDDVRTFASSLAEALGGSSGVEVLDPRPDDRTIAMAAPAIAATAEPEGASPTPAAATPAPHVAGPGPGSSSSRRARRTVPIPVVAGAVLAAAGLLAAAGAVDRMASAGPPAATIGVVGGQPAPTARTTPGPTTRAPTAPTAAPPARGHGHGKGHHG